MYTYTPASDTNSPHPYAPNMTDTQAPPELMHPFVPLALGVILGAVGAALLYVGLGDDGDSTFVAAGAVLGLIGSLSALVGVIAIGVGWGIRHAGSI